MDQRIACFVILLALSSSIAQDFGYDGAKGPSNWGKKFNSCQGKHQSPININMHNVKKVNLPPLIFTGFDEPPISVNMTNNGHTVQLTIDSKHIPTISGGPLNGEYQYAQLHFHWGDNDTFGSEDEIDGRSFPMELHMVFYKMTYGNSKAAMLHADGLTVLAFFYEISTKDNEYYEDFTEILKNITNVSETASFADPPALKTLISQNRKNYFTYDGSLTTPPCSEVVTWIDFQEPIPLSHNQIELFRALLDDDGHPLTHNFRPVQPLGDRIVRYNTDEIIKDVDLDDVHENEIPGNELENIKHHKHKNEKSHATKTSTTFFTIFLVPLIYTLYL